MTYDKLAQYLIKNGEEGDCYIGKTVCYFFSRELPLEAFIESLKKRGFEESKLRRFLEDE